MRKLWKDRLGEVLTVEGIEFKIVDVEEKGVKLIVEDNKFNDLHETTRATWRRGSLTKLVREIKKLRMVGKTKKVGDYLFKIVEFAKQKFVVEIEGDDLIEEVEISKDTWKRGTFIGTLRKLGIKISKKVKKIYLPMIINVTKKVIEKNSDEDINKIKTIYNLQELKSFYRKLSKKLHPDMGGDSNLFAKAHEFYENRKEAIKITLEDDDYNTPNFKELVNIMEEMIEFSKQTGDYYKQN